MQSPRASRQVSKKPYSGGGLGFLDFHAGKGEFEVQRRVDLRPGKGRIMVEEALVAAIVAEVSERMSDPNYAQIAVGRFVESQPTISRYLSARASDLGGQAVVHAVFHAELLVECVARSDGRAFLEPIGFDALDAAAQGKPVEELEKEQPALAGYIASNVEEESLRETLSLVALTLARFQR